MPSSVRYEENRTLQFVNDEGEFVYEVDLERRTDSAKTLDFIFQVLDKPWCTPELMYSFLTELDKAFNKEFGQPLQGVLCPFGTSKKTHWPVYGSYIDGC